MALYFISDLHLASGQDPATRRFVQFLEGLGGENVLILGGDIFDLFVGNKKVFRESFASLLHSLVELARRGTKIHFLEGNHDFHMREVFAGCDNIRVHSGAFPLGYRSCQIWVAHGDEIDREDYGYRLLRFLTRSRPFQIFLALLPGLFLAAIGQWSSQKSRKYHSLESQESKASDRTKNLFREYAASKIAEGYDYVFLGHSHLADRLPLAQKDRRGEYVNLGFSREKLLYAVLGAEPDSPLELGIFSAGNEK